MERVSGRRIVIDLHAPASPYIVVEFVKTITSHINKNILVPAVTRPTGLAAQSGVPEAWRHAYKNETPLVVVPEIRDLIEIYRPVETLIFMKTQDSIDIESARDYLEKETVLVVIPSGEQSITREETGLGKKIFSKRYHRDINPLTALGILLEHI